jgi:CDP-diglyceride synthetase
MSEEDPKSSAQVSAAERGIALALAVAVLVVFIFLVLSPRTMDGGTLAIVRFLAATFAGIAGYLFSGNLGLEAKMPLNKTQIKATGGFAAFVLVLFLFFVGVPPSSSSTNLQSEWITIKPIPYLNVLVDSFRLPTGKNNLSLRFVAPSWNIDFFLMSLRLSR